MIVFSLKISALLEDLVAEDSCKGSWEAVEIVWKVVKSQEKVRQFWNRKWVATLQRVYIVHSGLKDERLHVTILNNNKIL